MLKRGRRDIFVAFTRYHSHFTAMFLSLNQNMIVMIVLPRLYRDVTIIP